MGVYWLGLWVCAGPLAWGCGAVGVCWHSSLGLWVCADPLAWGCGAVGVCWPSSLGLLGCGGAVGVYWPSSLGLWRFGCPSSKVGPKGTEPQLSPLTDTWCCPNAHDSDSVVCWHSSLGLWVCADPLAWGCGAVGVCWHSSLGLWVCADPLAWGCGAVGVCWPSSLGLLGCGGAVGVYWPSSLGLWSVGCPSSKVGPRVLSHNWAHLQTHGAVPMHMIVVVMWSTASFDNITYLQSSVHGQGASLPVCVDCRLAGHALLVMGGLDLWAWHQISLAGR